jgi:hypothetical protein
MEAFSRSIQICLDAAFALKHSDGARLGTSRIGYRLRPGRHRATSLSDTSFAELNKWEFNERVQKIRRE